MDTVHLVRGFNFEQVNGTCGSGYRQNNIENLLYLTSHHNWVEKIGVDWWSNRRYTILAMEGNVLLMKQKTPLNRSILKKS